MNNLRSKYNAKPDIETETPLLVGGARNEHGTRICKRVKCQNCGTMDYITSRPKGGLTWCRSCAQKKLNAYEVGVQIPKTMIRRHCFVCRSPFDLPVTAVVKEKQPLCPNCLRGFEVWRGSLNMSPDKRSEMKCETRRSGTLLRKKRVGKFTQN